MKSNRSSTNWLVDAALFGGFIILFFLELTGVAAHQWLGLAAGALAIYHLLAHWGWVKAVAGRFFGRTTWEARLYLLVDILLCAGLGAIVLSGLLISTWLNLALGGKWLLWSAFHTLASQATLLVVVFKIAIHGEWIIRVARRLFSRRGAPAPTRAAGAAAGMGRRDFMRLMGVVGAASTWAILRTMPPVARTAAELLGAQPVEAASPPTVEAISAPVTPSAPASLPQASVTAPATVAQSTPTGRTDQPQATATAPAAVAQSTPTAQPTRARVTATPLATKAPTLCTKLCPRGQSCNYPGRCRSYRDRNGNGHCDLAEC